MYSLPVPGKRQALLPFLLSFSFLYCLHDALPHPTGLTLVLLNIPSPHALTRSCQTHTFVLKQQRSLTKNTKSSVAVGFQKKERRKEKSSSGLSVYQGKITLQLLCSLLAYNKGFLLRTWGSNTLHFILGKLKNVTFLAFTRECGFCRLVAL